MPKEAFDVEVKRTVTTTSKKKSSRWMLIIFGVLLLGLLAGLIAVSVLYSQSLDDLEVEKKRVASPVTPPATPPVTADLSTSTALPTPFQNPTWRLPEGMVEPIGYNFSLKINLPYNETEENSANAFTTEGKVAIHLRVLKDRIRQIVLHANTNLDQRWKDRGRISFAKENIQLTYANGITALKVRDVQFEPWAEVVRIDFDGELRVDQDYVLVIEYKGVIANDNQGLYRSFYHVNGEKKWLATSQFQPFKARRLLPCFDEPGYRAVFSTWLMYDARFTMTRTNGAAIRTTPAVLLPDGRNWVTATFEPTPKMPAYLLAFLISDFGILNGVATTGNRNGSFNVIARQSLLDDGNQGDFALEQGIAMIQNFSNKFDQPYYEHLSKLDMAAAPDFNSGAMENWGLVLYRESRMLYRAGVSSANDKMGAALIIGHELAHMLFGNLLTCHWWSETWLNEGFARFFQYILAYDTVSPDWDLEKLFPYSVIRQAFQVDSWANAHPLNNPNTNTPAEIQLMFDTVTYAKGGSLLQMVKGVMGDQAFFEAIYRYLADNKLSSVRQQYLFEKFGNTNVAGLNFSAALDNWVTKSGYPVLTLTRDDITGEIQFEQKRFMFKQGNATLSEEQNHIWNIPVSIQRKDEDTSEVKSRHCWITKRSGELKAECPSLNIPSPSSGSPLTTGDWLLANVEQQGFYRVNYDRASWNRLFAQLDTNHTIIDERNRGQIIDDAFNLARSGQFGVDYDLALSSTRYLRKGETRYGPLASAFSGLTYIHRIFRNTTEDDHMRDYMQMLLFSGETPLYNQDDWKNEWVDGVNEDLNRAFRQTLILETACHYGLPQCLNDAKDRFEKWAETASFAAVTGEDNIANIKSAMLCYGIRQSNASVWEKMLERHNNETSTGIKLELLAALACTDDAALLNRLMTLSLAGDTIRAQDAGALFGYISKFYLGEALAWRFIQDRWNELKGAKSTILANVANGFKTAEQLEELRTFFGSLPNADEEKTAFDKAIAETESNIAWSTEHYATVSQFFERETAAGQA